MHRLGERLKVERILRVCCIDDENSSSTLGDLASVASVILQMNESDIAKLNETNPEVVKLLELLQEEDVLGKVGELTRILEAEVSDGRLAEEQIQAAVLGNSLSVQQPDSVTSRIKAVFSKSEAEFKSLSFKEWDDTAGQILSTASKDNRILLLVDRTNSAEPDTETDGIKVLVSLFEKFHSVGEFVDCVIVTSSVHPEHELTASHEIYKTVHEVVRKGNVGRARKVFVLAKERLSKDDTEIQDDFLIHFDRLKAARLGRELASASRQILIDAVSEATDWLEEVSLPEFHWSVFRSSEQEGASEIQTLLRLVSLKQGLKLEKEFPSDPRIVEAIRGLRTIPKDHVAHSASPQELEAMRKLEFERDGRHINRLRQPIMCGDVFAISGQAGDGNEMIREAVLLGNPCDLTIRSDGKRTAKFGLLAIIEKVSRSAINERIEKSAEKNDELSRLAIVFSTGDTASDMQYIIRPNKVETIPLPILDLVWTNDDGKATASSNYSAMASDMLSPSQDKAAKKIKPHDQKSYPAVSLFGIPLNPTKKAVQVPGVGQVNIVEYNITRTWRLTDEYAAAALLAFAQAMSRPAFGHDFLRGWEIRSAGRA